MKSILFIVSLLGFVPIATRAQNGGYEIRKMVEPRTGKRVSILRMQHHGAPETYDATRRCLDSLKAAGYVTFYESLHMVPFHVDTLGDVSIPQLRAIPIAYTRADSLHLDTLMRKCRRMLGFMIGDGGYDDPENETVRLKNRDADHVWQSADRLGLTTERDLWVDYSAHDCVEVFERKHGPIVLTEYDFKTPLTQKYAPPEKESPRRRDEFSLFLRNDYLIRRIVQSEHRRIAVVYGTGHTDGIVWQLKKRHGFKTDKSK